MANEMLELELLVERILSGTLLIKFHYLVINLLIYRLLESPSYPQVQEPLYEMELTHRNKASPPN
jgi:hypothetical protein